MLCQKCFSPVEDAATVCRSCGQSEPRKAPVGVASIPVKKRHPIRKFFLIVFGICAAFLVLVAVIDANMSPETNAKIAEMQADETRAKDAVEIEKQRDQHAADETKRLAAATRDAEVWNVGTGATSIRAVMRNPDSLTFSNVWLMPSGAVCYKYRAQNGFGGLNIEDAVKTPKGQILSNSASTWNHYCAGQSGKDETWEAEYYSK